MNPIDFSISAACACRRPVRPMLVVALAAMLSPCGISTLSAQSLLESSAVAVHEPVVGTVGSQAPDFTLSTPEGRPLRLADLRGKYVLLDFWGTWCHWCIKGVPAMKAAYDKHKDRVEFVSIACRDTRERWLAALDEYRMPWPQLIDDVMVGTPSLYGVRAYPTKVLISPSGTILMIFEGELPEFYTRLEAALAP